ncbi:2Fe-2S iron-sulfur cluster binding domain-containing protein [Sneathiella sp. P13V-1]|uniref:adenylate/guanylate cyclase domain-containing protein n=1 Tax=Sneathiella sp. P13V-1 TaxID=2697366 RepID=UPI00187B3197|nr:adenylate/guanylate cyclase domain-containing protein [Sneathiella sp. P13V-1]MBE7635805.1 2Fe-2S iron-sulfur cluster binding domain-containing protein [Sneathiella sp. P13V-1]
MTSTTADTESGNTRLKWLRAERLRLYSGIVLMLFLTTHLLNHTLGLVSLEALEAGRDVFLAIWRNPLGSLLLLGALIIHVILVFAKLLAHRSYRSIPLKEAIQIIFGLAIPPMVIYHIIGTRIVHETLGVNDTYTYVIYALWIATPYQSLLQTGALLIAWAHGCIGVHFWLRLKPSYEKAYPFLYPIALILPVLAICGFLVAAHDVEILAQDQEWLKHFFAKLGLTNDDLIWAEGVRDTGYILILGAWIILGLSRLFWSVHFRVKQLVTVKYPDGREVRVTPGTTVLEASQSGDIPHAAVCGGRGRCSTCRIRIIEGAHLLAPPSDQELSVLKRVGATENTRLACQVAAVGNLSVIPLLPQQATSRAAFSRPDYLQGREKTIAILFADLRAFTKFSETKLPYDVVFVINQYFRHMGEAIENSGGHLDKFIGDGVMALFGLEDEPKVAAENALKAAKAMSDALDRLNDSLKSDLEEPLRLGIGIHIGQVIIGEMGYGKATSITAIGDSVNTASRLEGLTKEYGAQLIFSDRLARAAEFEGSSRTEEVSIRGRAEPLKVHIMTSAQALP